MLVGDCLTLGYFKVWIKLPNFPMSILAKNYTFFIMNFLFEIWS